MRVLLTTEGTFPYSGGGVSTWASSLITGLPRHEFTVAALVANPPTTPVSPVPTNAAVVPVPLWGVERVDEYLPRRYGSMHKSFGGSRALSQFLEPFALLVDQVIQADPQPATVAHAIGELAEFTTSYDLRRAMRDPKVWELVRQQFRANPLYRHLTLSEAVGFARTLYRYLLPLAICVPDVDIVHSSAAGICAIPAIAAKARLGTPLVLTEHGIYLRERILELVRRKVGALEKMLFSNLYRAIAQASYHVADRVAPVCRYNTGWETELGLEASKVRVIHNGVDPIRFSPGLVEHERPTLVWVGRIHPLKDLLTLIRAVDLVRVAIPKMLCKIYGPDDDREYGSQCRAAVREAGLTRFVRFEGPTTDVPAVYHASDLVVLSSMSEGFPYSVVEAMMCGRPVVATDVGGVSEALGDSSLLAEPQNASSLADAVIRHLKRPSAERDLIGRRLRERAVVRFAEDTFLESYDALYEELHESAC